MIPILLSILLGSLSIGGLLFFVYKRSINKQVEQQRVNSESELFRRKAKITRRQKITQFLHKSYVTAVKIPLVGRYVIKVRKRLTAINVYDELTIRKETMRITFLVLGGLTLSVLLFSLIGNDITFTFFALLTAVVINGTLIDSFVNKVADRLLVQQTELIEDTRNNYNQHKMVDEAIAAAAETSKLEISNHAREISEAIASDKAEERLDAYYEVAPNRFLKLFAGVSHLVKEYGDKSIKDRGSMYLHILNRIKSEIYEEILFRKKLRYYLNSLTVVAIVPVFFLKPIELWAKKIFPVIGDFYDSKFGFITKVFIFIAVILSYMLIKRIQDNEDSVHATQPSKHKWLKALYSKRLVSVVVDRMVPSKSTTEYFENERLLKETNSSLTMEWFYLQRILACLAAIILTISMFFYMHSVTINNTINSTSLVQKIMILGQTTSSGEDPVSEWTEFDRSIISSLKGVRVGLEDKVAFLVNQKLGQGASASEITLSTERITKKITTINNEYFKWWELLISLAVGAIAYQVPLWMRRFQRRMREMQMKIEVNQMHTIISILSEIERVSVEETLIWMERFSTIFKTPLKTCILNFDSGPMEALEQMLIEAPFPPFVRTIERLQNALEKVTLKEAFEDLESDRAYFEEEKKQENERIINKKTNWGRLIGFTPMNVVIFFYLVFPFIYLSIVGSMTLFEQLNQQI